MPNTGRHTSTALVAGAIAITLNTLALKAADAIPLATAHGGLLRLIGPLFIWPLHRLGISTLWIRSGGPMPSTPAFQTGFHVVVGLAMALFYAFMVEPILPGRALAKGVAYAAIVWLLNAVLVLPLTGEGFAGSAHLTIAGMTWFAVAHTLFFVVLALLYQRLARRAQARPSR